MRNLFRAFLVVFSLSFLMPSSAFAQEDVVDQERLESVMTNVGNQFIYAFFGKDILIIYLSDPEEIMAIRASSDSELATLTAPFNPLSGKFLMSALSVIYALSVGYFLLRLSLFLLEQAWLMQRNEEAPLTEKEARGILIKFVLLGGLVLVPIPLSNEITDDTFYTSAAVGGLFHFLGVSHEMADDSVKVLIENQRQTLKTVTLPAADAKQYEMMSVNEFFTCLSLQEPTLNYYAIMNFYQTDRETAEGVISQGDCSLKVSLGIDTQSDEKIARLLSQDPSLPLVPGVFKEAQKRLFAIVLEDAFEDARRNSRWLSMPRHSNDFMEGSDKMRPFTGSVLTSSELDRWDDFCERINELDWSSEEAISGYDRGIYHIWTSRCMSKKVTSRMLYPESYDALDGFLNEGTGRQHSLALCVDQASLAEVVSGSRFSAQYTTGSQGVSSSNVESIPLNSCITSLCSSASLESGGMYACANAIDLYESSLRDSKLVERGTMTLGFYMFNLFVHNPPSAMAKEVFNRFSFSFSSYGIDPMDGDDPYMTVSFRLPEPSSNVHELDEIIIDLQNTLGRDDLPAVSPVRELSDLPSWLGYSRLLTCAQSPLQVSGGYVCNNLPQEFSRFGFSLLQNAITVKTLMTMGNTTNLLRVPKTPGGFIGDRAASESGMKTALLSSALVFAAGHAGVIDTIYNKVGGLNFAGSDEFGHLDRAQMAEWAEMPVIVGIMALGKASSESGVIKFIEYLLLGALLIGVLFAFLMPLFPMIMVLSALTKFAYILLKTIVLTGFRLTDAIFESDPDFIGEQMDRMWAEWLALLLKLPLLVIGIMLAWLMSNIVVAHVLANISLVIPTNDGVQGVLDLFVILVVTSVIIFIIYNMVLTVIESFYDFTVEWVLGTLTNSPFADRKAVGWKDSKDILQFIGR